MYQVFVLVLSVLTFPLFVIIACFVWVTSGFPVFFRQQRVGKNGRIFTLYKFRTMYPGAERDQRRYGKKNESDGPTFKIQHDPRFTRIGSFLSHTGLDELPQLYNVFRGDMALLGPRPLPVSEQKRLSPWMRERERILPGIISPAILTGRYHENFSLWMKSDVSYVRTKSWKTDIILVVSAVGFLCRLLLRELVSPLAPRVRRRV